MARPVQTTVQQTPLGVMPKIDRALSDSIAGGSGNAVIQDGNMGRIVHVPFDMRGSTSEGVAPAKIVSGIGNTYIVDVYKNGDTAAVTNPGVHRLLPSCRSGFGAPLL